jgi:AcrR family transcriptional regulator
LPPSSQSADNRVSGKFQSDELRIAILDAAEKIFLETGIDKTAMSDIAERAGINRVTLYRYFASRNEVAMAVHNRLMKKTAQITQYDPHDHSLEGAKRQAQSMIRNFALLRDAYRYSGMFDQIYLDNPADSTLTRWTFNQLRLAGFGTPSAKEGLLEEPYGEEIKVIMSTVIWFLEKLALRGELTWSNKEIALEEDLQIFERMITKHFDLLIEAQTRLNNTADPPAE